MIKYLIFFLLSLSSFSLKGQSPSLMIGLGGIYGTSIDQTGLTSRIYYGVNEQLCFGPEFTHFPTVVRDDKSIQLNEYGFIVHYIFELKERISVFPLLGTNYSVEKSNYENFSEIEDAFGIVFGVGMHSEFKNFLPFVEYQYLTGSLSQSTFSVGLVYNLFLD